MLHANGLSHLINTMIDFHIIYQYIILTSIKSYNVCIRNKVIINICENKFPLPIDRLVCHSIILYILYMTFYLMAFFLAIFYLSNIRGEKKDKIKI